MLPFGAGAEWAFLKYDDHRGNDADSKCVGAAIGKILSLLAECRTT
jgi:hypothetical protein